MYLTARKHLCGFKFNDNEAGKADQAEYNAALAAVGLTRGDISESSPMGSVSLNVAYWRKANQIHNWFVQVVAGGEDDCRPVSVSREQLTDLRTLCEAAIAQRGKAAEILPTTNGFFFGSTEINDDYFDDLELTVRQLTAVLNNPKLQRWDFEYEASW